MQNAAKQIVLLYVKGLLRNFHLNGQTTVAEIQFVRDVSIQRGFYIT